VQKYSVLAARAAFLFLSRVVQPRFARLVGSAEPGPPVIFHTLFPFPDHVIAVVAGAVRKCKSAVSICKARA
jgi:hypothetical protein